MQLDAFWVHFQVYLRLTCKNNLLQNKKIKKILFWSLRPMTCKKPSHELIQVRYGNWWTLTKNVFIKVDFNRLCHYMILSCHQEVGSCCIRGESEEFIAHRRAGIFWIATKWSILQYCLYIVIVAECLCCENVVWSKFPSFSYDG